jgi:hypothetical protein
MGVESAVKDKVRGKKAEKTTISIKYRQNETMEFIPTRGPKKDIAMETEYPNKLASLPIKLENLFQTQSNYVILPLSLIINKS